MISAIVAIDENNGIGYNNELLCSIPEDMQRFKELTLLKAVVMGRKTWESLPKKPLKDRFNVIITRNPKEIEIPKGYEDYVMACTLNDVKQVLEWTEKEYVVIGGETIYKELLPYVNILYVTRLHKSFEKVDAFFPDFLKEEPENWELACKSSQYFYKDIPYSFECYKRPIDFYEK